MAKIEAAEAPEELMDLSHLDKDEDQALMYPECRCTRAIAFHDCGIPLVSEPGVSVYTRANPNVSMVVVLCGMPLLGA